MNSLDMLLRTAESSTQENQRDPRHLKKKRDEWQGQHEGEPDVNMIALERACIMQQQLLHLKQERQLHMRLQVLQHQMHEMEGCLQEYSRLSSALPHSAPLHLPLPTRREAPPWPYENMRAGTDTRGGPAFGFSGHHRRDHTSAYTNPGYPQPPPIMKTSNHAACAACHRSKLACDKGRPCGRCLKRGIPCVSRPKVQLGRPRKSQKLEEPCRGGPPTPTGLTASDPPSCGPATPTDSNPLDLSKCGPSNAPVVSPVETLKGLPATPTGGCPSVLKASVSALITEAAPSPLDTSRVAGAHNSTGPLLTTQASLNPTPTELSTIHPKPTEHPNPPAMSRNPEPGRTALSPSPTNETPTPAVPAPATTPTVPASAHVKGVTPEVSFQIGIS